MPDRRAGGEGPERHDGGDEACVLGAWRPDSFVGRRIGDRYQILELIGEGGMGAVFRAQHMAIERPVALKVLSPACLQVPNVQERFFREARVTNRIRHRNVLDVLDLGETADGLPYSVMDLLFGETLAEREARGKVPIAELLEVALQVCDGLAAAHDLCIIHRDVTPSNIFLIRRGTSGVVGPQVKILDFGIAFVKAEARLTLPGQVMGTPRYISPEVVLGHDLTTAADVYSLGVVLYEALAGRPPFDDPNHTVLAAKHATDDPPPLAEICPKVPARLTSLVMQCLAKHRDDRPQGVRAIADDLRAVMRELGGPSRRSVPPEAQPSAAVHATTVVASDAAPSASQASGTSLTAWKEWLAGARVSLRRSGDRRLLAELGRVEAALREIESLDEEVASCSAERAELEADGAATQERFAQALEALSQEQAKVSEELTACVEQLERASGGLSTCRCDLAATRERVASAEEASRRGASTLPGKGDDEAVVDEALLRAYAEAGQAATAYEEAAAVERAARRARQDREEELRDIRFQIQELHRSDERGTTALGQRLRAVHAELARLDEQRAELYRVLIEAAGLLSGVSG